MHAERDHLVRVIFPELKERCSQRRVHLIDVDLRWGVTQEQAEGGGALDICLDEIDSCRPYFLGLLGHRYGTVSEGQGRSITAAEIYHGVLHNSLPRQLMDLRPFVRGILEGRTLYREQVETLVRCYQWDPQKKKHLLGRNVTPEDEKTLRSIFDQYSLYQRDRSFFFFRSESFTRKLAGSNEADFFETEYSLKSKLETLKREIGDAGLPVFEYEELESFGQKVLETLWQRIDAEFPEKREGKRDWLEEEAEFHELFMADRTRRFVGRSDILKDMHIFVVKDSEARLLVVTGEPGCGKSALMARFAEEVIHHRPDWLILSHFVGASPSSANLRMTLRRFCTHLNRALGSTEEVPEDFRDLVLLFPQLLEMASKEHHILVLIDAVNQMERGDNAHSMSWLPQRIPENARVVISTLAGEALDALKARHIQPLFETVSGLKEDEIRQLTAGYLEEIRRRFPTEDITQVFHEKVKAGNPLYIIVALEEMRVFPYYEGMEERVTQLPDTLPKLFDQVLQRVEGDFNRPLVEDFTSLIACGRHGLTAEELQTLLRRHAVVIDPANPPERLPDMLFARLRRSLSAYLFQRSGVIDFFHGQLKEAVGRRYLAEEAARDETHHIIADYLEQRWAEPYLRALDELPHQLTKAKGWEGLERVLCDLGFIEAKCAAEMTYELIHDYSTALDSLPEAQPEKQERLKREERLRKYIEGLIAYAKGEIKTLDIILSVRPWTDEEIKADAERIINNPTRLDRIRAFAQFVNSEGHVLAKLTSQPGFCIQHAYNMAGFGPVGLAADSSIGSGVDRILLLRHQSQRRDYSLHPALLRTLEGHTNYVESVSVTPDGKRAVSAGMYDKTLRVWDLESGRCLRTLEGPTSGVESVSVTPDGKRVVSAGSDGTLRVWDLESGRCLRTLEGPISGVESVSVTADGRRAVSGGRDATLRVWDLESGRCLETIEGPTSGVRSMSVTPDGKRAVSGGWDGTLRMWDLESGQCLRTLEGHTSGVESVSVTPDGKSAVSAGMYDRTLRVWDLESGRCLRTLEGHTSKVGSVSVTADGRRAVSGGWDGTLRVWDLESGRCLRTLEGHTGGITSVSVTPDGKRAVSGGWVDETLRVWDLESGRCLRTLEGHTGGVDRVSVTPDGRRAVSGGWNDKTLRVWDLESGRCVAVLPDYAGFADAKMTANGVLVCGTRGGDVLFVTCHGLKAQPPLATPVRVWLQGQETHCEGSHPIKSGKVVSHWEDSVGTTCPWCGQRFQVEEGILNIIRDINRNARLSPDRSPCFELPAESWDDPRLLLECSTCHKPLKFNPFIVDNRGRY
jgi:WD40 repeat protein